MKKLLYSMLVLLILISGCSNNNTSNERSNHQADKKTIKIGYLPITHAANLMMTKKVLESRRNGNYNLELVRFNNWPDLMDALNSGRIDGASTLIELAMKSKQKGSPIKAAALGHHEGNVIMGQKGKSVEDLHNHNNYSFAIPHRYSTHYLLLEEMRKQLKLDHNTFDYHEMAPAEMPAALNENRIAGYSVAEPFGALGEKLGKGHTLKHGSEIIPDAYCCALVLREDLINNQHDVAQQFMTDYKKAGYQMTDKSKSVDVMSKHFKQDDKVLAQSAEWTSYGDLTIEEDGYQKITELVQEHKLFTAPSYKSFVDSSLYKEG
ncbi:MULTISPECIES: ABC transporter substrate-binding protein [Staphylococcus]|uniref:ABC transporter substrate-binding protein n=1 Tax=Staphylococcus TaxID=1279 RepID=UPI000D1B3472|nr:MULTISPECIES: ABC transporter substrate-binding protein [Staphylococcus]KAB2479082.1 ABC transporter substrate-binding protein [Staphylococcus sp. CH99b_3]MCD8834551.1 ABC transporter substrate-binding protein [Staphylococcus arlettae]MCD8839023.1 ABC transporter substrate-binding protein [Staphylococcus arlettae]MCD8849913.1 ABC transporter substrate-binding protein [Staphylococcus arlettae]MCD8864182.1 ABC transporter substrate-binding protein [Staphylococcus arlettae]